MDLHTATDVIKLLLTIKTDEDRVLLGYKNAQSNLEVSVLQVSEQDAKAIELRNRLEELIGTSNTLPHINVVLGHLEDAEKLGRKDLSQFNGEWPIVMMHSPDKTMYF